MKATERIPRLRGGGRRRVVGAFGLLAVASMSVIVSAARSSERAAGPWPHMTGAWSGTGRFLGSAASADLRWEAVLGGRFYRLTQRISTRRGDSTQTFEGHAYYTATTAANTSGTWFDVQGNEYHIEAALSDSAIDARWGPARSTFGHTVYRVVANRLTVADSVRGEDGRWREFGSMAYTRAR